MKEGEERGVLHLAWNDAACWVAIGGSIGWGWLAGRVLPQTACAGRSWLAAGMAVQVVLTAAALGLTVGRAARHRMDGCLVLFTLGIILMLSFPSFLMVWFEQTCWHLTM